MVGLLLGLFVGNQAGGSAFGAAKTAVTGVWSFVSETDTEKKELVRDNRTWTGVWVFTGGYHALARMENARTSLTKPELAARPVAEQVNF